MLPDSVGTLLTWWTDMEDSSKQTVKLFPCTHQGCYRKFVYQVNLKRHIRMKHATKHGKHLNVTCKLCKKEMRSDHLKRHIESKHKQEEEGEAAVTVSANQELKECNLIVDQFLAYFIHGKQVEESEISSIVQMLIDETINAREVDANYYISLGNVFKLLHEQDAASGALLLKFVDQLACSIKFDLQSRFDYNWVIVMFAIGTELIRTLPNFQDPVTAMLCYLLYRAGNDLKILGGWRGFLDKYTTTL